MGVVGFSNRVKIIQALVDFSLLSSMCVVCLFGRFE